MKKRVLYGVLIAVLGLNLLAGVQIYFSSAEAAGKEDPYAHFALFSRVMELIRQDYVDGERLSYQELMGAALKGMVGTLDPHSEYMEPQKFEELKKDTEGAFGGVGIVIGVRTNEIGRSYITVIEPMENTPAIREGILANDQITHIEGKSTEKFTIEDAVKLLRGKPGTEVTIGIRRPASNLELKVKLRRAIIKVETVKDINGRSEFPLDEHKIGYVRLRQFGEKTGDDLERALTKLTGQGMRALILDLRGNPGGLLDQAVRISEKFLPRGQLVVSTEGRIASQKMTYAATGRSPLLDILVVVLVNRNSASASEIVAGCLQDVNRAIVLGEQTFGKGSVQSILPLQNGAALRLTTAKYYTPSHKVIHERGITPDIIVPMSEEEEYALLLKRAPGGMEGLDPAERARLEKYQDVQLERAVDVLKAIMLFTQRNGNGQGVERVAGVK